MCARQESSALGILFYEGTNQEVLQYISESLAGSGWSAVVITVFFQSEEWKSGSLASMALHQGSLAILENNVGVSDAVLLDPVSEDAFIENLRLRYQHNQIYVRDYECVRSTLLDILVYYLYIIVN